MLLDINIDVPQYSECASFDSMPLPCSAKMWQAESRIAWEAEYKNYLSERKGSQMLKFGMLKDSLRLEVCAVERDRVDDLELWCTGADGFCALVITVARGI